MPSTAQPEINNVWGSTERQGLVTRITLPSGQTADCKRIGMEGLVEAGILNDMDGLTGVVDQRFVKRARNGGKPTQEIDVAAISEDPESLKRIILVVDRALPHIVVEPTVRLHLRDLPNGKTEMIPDDEREAGVYTDQIGFEDKMFLLNWAVGGSADPRRFLDESGDVVGNVAPSRSVRRAAKRAPRSTTK